MVAIDVSIYTNILIDCYLTILLVKTPIFLPTIIVNYKKNRLLLYFYGTLVESLSIYKQAHTEAFKTICDYKSWECCIPRNFIPYLRPKNFYRNHLQDNPYIFGNKSEFGWNLACAKQRIHRV